jgi:inositol transport system substrate-binding protein
MRRFLLAGVATILMSAPAMATNIGVTMASFDDNFLTTLRQAIGKEAQAKGVQIQFEDAQTDIGRQLSQVQNFVAQHVDAIIVNPADRAATKTITQAVVKSGIPLVYVNRAPDQKQLPEKVVVVVSGHVLSGRLEMPEIAKCLNGKGNVAIMLGELASNATQDRTKGNKTKGNKEVIAQYPGIKVVQEQITNYQRNQVIDLMNNWLQSGTKIDGVVANNDEMAIGAIIALQQAGIAPNDKCIGGIAATPDAVAEMTKGNLYGTVSQDANGQGQNAVGAAIKLAKGEKVDQYVTVPYEPVTHDNYKSYSNR